MLGTRRSLAIAVIAAVLGLARAAVAQPAAAELVFRKARALMKEGKTAEACEAFAHSQELDPQLGTEYNIGLCLAKLGKTASAWTALRAVAQRDTNPARKAQAAARADELEPLLVKVSLVVRAPVPGLVITSNGEDITRLVGVEFPVDPGTYQIAARAPGYREFTTTLVAESAGAALAIYVPELARLAQVPEPAPPIEPRAVATPPPHPEPVAPVAAPSGSRRRTIGIAVGSGGVVALAAGAIAGVLARNQWNAAKSTCGAAVRCDSDADYARAQHQVDAARLRGDVATGLVAVGAVAVGAGIALWLTAPRDAESRTALRLAPVSDGRSVAVLLRGGF